MLQVEIFNEQSDVELGEAINYFLSKLETLCYKDIKFLTTLVNQKIVYHALIIYEVI